MRACSPTFQSVNRSYIYIWTPELPSAGCVVGLGCHLATPVYIVLSQLWTRLELARSGVRASESALIRIHFNPEWAGVNRDFATEYLFKHAKRCFLDLIFFRVQAVCVCRAPAQHPHPAAAAAAAWSNGDGAMGTGHSVAAVSNTGDSVSWKGVFTQEPGF
jgi:hypothetical protein